MAFEVFTEFSFLNCLSIIAFFTTVGLFFCGIPICRQIWKRKDTNEISGAPFIMGVLGGTCWLTYGILKNDETVKYVTSAQVVLYTIYVIFYFFMSKKKFWITIKILVLITICVSLGAAVHFFGMKVFHPLGIVCMTLNTMDFAAPLAGLKVVIRRRATSTLPLPLCIANFMVSTEWFIYGLLKKDFYLITPNGIGSFLAFAQLILFIVLPRKPNQRVPLLRLYDYVRRCGSDRVKDIEAAAVVPEEKDDECKINKHRWSDRVIANVTGEIGNVMNKVHLVDQFAYSDTLNKLDEVSTDSLSTATPDTVQTPVEGKPVAFPVTIRNEEELLELSRHLASKLIGTEQTAQSSEEPSTESFQNAMKRCQSAPDLRK
jgi:solute carrier family 50 protein (sugar transporter)